MPPQPIEPRSAAPVAGVTVSVQIGLAETGQYIGRLRIVVGGGPPVERLLSDVKCDVLVDALALLTSMETGSTGAEAAPDVLGNPVVVTTNQPPRSAEATPKVETPRPEGSVDRPVDWTVSALVGLITAPAPNPLPSGGVASGALLGASSAAVAEAAIAPSLSAGAAVTGSVGIGTATVTLTLVKAVALGLGLGASALGGAHWVAGHGSTAPTTLRASNTASLAVQRRLPPQPVTRAFALVQPAPAIASVESVTVTNSVNPPVQTRELVTQPSVS